MESSSNNTTANSIKVSAMTFWLKYRLTIVGMIVGAVGGYLYYHFVGCASGTCMITSKPLNSSLYGAMMGGLLFNTMDKQS